MKLFQLREDTKLGEGVLITWEDEAPASSHDYFPIGWCPHQPRKQPLNAVRYIIEAHVARQLNADL